MQDIEDKTDGAWRPGPGTIYPLLKSLVKEGQLKHSGRQSGTSRISYSITARGGRQLAKMQRAIASFGRKERAIIRLFSELMPATLLVPILINRAREGAEVIRSKVSELEDPAKTAALKELALVAENLLDWARSNIAETKMSRTPRGQEAIRYP